MAFNFIKENYAITITPNSKKKVFYAADFEPMLDILRKASIEIVAKRFEIKKDNTLHMHLACTGPQGLYYQKLQKQGWQVFVKPIFDGVGWLSYLDKTSCNDIEEEQLLQEHYLRHNNMFTFNLDD